MVEFNDINDLDQVRIALSEVAGEHPDRVFTDWVDGLEDSHPRLQSGTCYNFIDYPEKGREARCLVGQVLDKFGLLYRLSIGQLHATVHMVKHTVGITNEKVVDYLWVAQREQDRDISWGESFLEAEKENI